MVLARGEASDPTKSTKSTVQRSVATILPTYQYDEASLHLRMLPHRRHSRAKVPAGSLFYFRWKKHFSSRRFRLMHFLGARNGFF
jgi:hypothetical protein